MCNLYSDLYILQFDMKCPSFYCNSSRSFQTYGPLRFVVQFECFGAVQEAELKEGGKDVEVTFENREEYVRRRCF